MGAHAQLWIVMGCCARTDGRKVYTNGWAHLCNLGVAAGMHRASGPSLVST
jgi:hypothetical protein